MAFSVGCATLPLYRQSQPLYSHASHRDSHLAINSMVTPTSLFDKLIRYNTANDLLKRCCEPPMVILRTPNFSHL